MSTIYDWSLKASENAGADDFINWSEGQSPHTVNNSARGMMQRVREYLSDIGGALDSHFEVDHHQQQTIILLNSSASLSRYSNGLSLRFKARESNVGVTAVTLNNLSSKSVYKASETGVTAVVGGEIQRGGVYTLVYDEALSGWQLLNPTIIRPSPQLRHLPTGFIGAFAMERLPEGWLPCDGRSYSRDKYRTLFATIGTMWGQGGDETTFNVPDLRGMFLRGFDYTGFVDHGRIFASVQQSSLINHEHSVGFFPPVEKSTRRKRSVVVDYIIIPQGPNQDEECIGLSGDALERCHEGFEREVVLPSATPSFIGEKVHTLHPFFLKHGRKMMTYRIPKQAGEDLGEHDHIVMMGSFGGVETRPVNVSIVYGIKT
ncbi:phage tail protein [Bartonella tribocorum]|uniref:phage tail protein n=1 Tax=Bartonella tribocorum TaxID=85701 RepID=UPI001ABA8032|nr:phage tail protein [Bartonella tribocorum]